MKQEIKSRIDNQSLQVIANSARRGESGMLDLLRRLVEQESPSNDKASVDRCMQIAALACQALDGSVKWHRQRHFANLLEARFGFGSQTRTLKPVLLLGHLDTVWPLGCLQSMPCRQAGGRIYGPGVLDMKAGVAMALSALAILREHNFFARPVILLLNSDEEVGSPVSRSTTESIAARCEAVFVLEPAQGLGGAYKTSRKGVGSYMVRVNGVAAHAGIDFASGHSAVVELAHQIARISAITDPARGITVNPGVCAGGTQSNVVAAEAWAEVDFRFIKASDAKKIERKFLQMRPIDKKCGLVVSGGVNRPPMERTRRGIELFAKAATLAGELGFELHEAATGGGSDGNFTSAIGIPTLDGMGAVGEGAHANHESVLIEHLVPRTALLAAMIATV
ncbi:M20 family metallopeptidase [Acidisarcina polymorpha]|nr:M20 family metallopeptidase [Acidisarcina polymorpha]